MPASHGTVTTISTYKYDKTGNVTEYTSPDAGKVTMTYTPQGQIKSRTTATGEKTEYGYDYGRLSTITYENHPQDAVTYTYADSTAAEPNSKGRLTEVKDPSGTERYTYGSMGEVTRTERTLNIDPQTGTVHSYTYGAAYDSWGRVREMTYPDGETVTYLYYSTGELRSITGESGKGGETYLDRAGYDPYGRTVYRKMGNGTEHTYTYDINERLKNSLLSLDGETVSSSTYTYDPTDNITGIRGVSESLYNQKYTYDDMNRLTGASGMDTGGNSDDGSAFSSYVMTMSYNQMSSPQRYELTKMSQSDTKVTENEYLYSTESSNPHAPMQIGDMTYTYSASGNPLTIEGSKISRSLTWDSENRLRELTDQRRGIQSRYTYNHTGERSLKRYGAYESMAVNGAAAGSLLDPKSAYSAYVSPYYVEHGRGTESGAVTKHYYAGAERLASKVVTTTAKESEESSYYYFTDHLGSTTHITDRSGRTSQYAAYTPYGTLFREYRNVLPYRFNGKELDQETGYYYYGARYYDPGTVLWFGTDPLAHKYPMNSPYVYCNGNPVKYVDPDGRWPWENDNIQRARNDALNIGGSVNLVQGEYGIDAQILNNRGEVVNTKYATAGNQKTPLRNFVETLDKGGYSHAGGTTDITTQDVAVATGVIGVITGGMSLLGGTLIVGGISAAEGSASVAGILNSLDDIGTNAKGESLLQQSVGSDIGKQVVTATKTAISITNVITDILNNRNLLGAMDGINNIVSIVISNTNENK